MMQNKIYFLLVMLDMRVSIIQTSPTTEQLCSDILKYELCVPVMRHTKSTLESICSQISVKHMLTHPSFLALLVIHMYSHSHFRSAACHCQHSQVADVSRLQLTDQSGKTTVPPTACRAGGVSAMRLRRVCGYTCSHIHMSAIV